MESLKQQVNEFLEYYQEIRRGYEDYCDGMAHIHGWKMIAPYHLSHHPGLREILDYKYQNLFLHAFGYEFFQPYFIPRETLFKLLDEYDSQS